MYIPKLGNPPISDNTAHFYSTATSNSNRNQKHSTQKSESQTKATKQVRDREKKKKEVMNNLSPSSSNAATHYYISTPKTAIFILLFLFIIGVGVSLFILIEVHNALFLIASLLLSAIVSALLLWNAVCFRRNTALLLFLRSFPVSDLRHACHGQLVHITGPVSCADVCLESSYEKVGGCVYTSTLLYEYEGFGLNAKQPCFLWKLAYSERFSTDFYISDKNSGIRTLVKAGYGCGLIPLIVESRLVYTRKNRILSPNLTKWLTDRNLSADSRVIRLEEGHAA
ncbi:uncharacterized membrane protein At1g16860 isoform X2 [Beta vulgaris subsp. vulgaris]|uniref:uncharacterized membrane protein At1g16860 isoform X2 n=1 Tax=Beta vulgaris subsp. vulgaris TaxID=3555 RepID=UPI002036FA3C|nr:uncharacterized membrane protein At1g16860 isoform X2 [Beta vulgaris subsp. vulgaris]